MKPSLRHSLLLTFFALPLLPPPLVAPSSIAASPVAGEPSLVLLAKWGTNGTAEGQFDAPGGVAANGAGDIYVADTGNNRIQKFDSDGNFLLTWGWGVRTGASKFEICPSSCQSGLLGGGDGQFRTLADVAVDGAGYVYVADYNNHRIQKFSSNGTFVAKWGAQGDGWTGFYFPRSLAADASGEVYVSDSGNYRIKKHSTTGAFRYTWGWGVRDGTTEYQVCGILSPCQIGLGGSGEGQFNAPAGVAVDASGNVYVADQYNDRIQVFDSGVNFVAEWGASGVDSVVDPMDVELDSHGNVYVVELAGHISKFDRHGNMVVRWGKAGSGDGEFAAPRGVAVDAAGNIYVVERDNHRVQKFRQSWLDVFVGNEEPGIGR